MVFNVNNISVISWLSVLLVEETECPEKTTDLSQVTDKLYYPLANEVAMGYSNATVHPSVASL